MSDAPRPFKLQSDYQPAGDQPQAIARLIDGLESGLAHQTLLGVTGSGKTFTIANVIQHVQRPTLVMAHNKTLAAQLYGEFKEYFPENSVEYFVSYYDYYQPEAYVPSSDTYIEKDASVNAHIEQMRLSATKALLERHDSIIVATVSAIYGLGDPQAYLSMVLHLVRGDRLDQRKLLRRLADMQYTRNELDLAQGSYRVRGDVIDIFPAESEREAVRIELFDDEIEALAWFDPLTGEVLRKVPRLTVYPSSHYVTPRERIDRAIELIREELRSRLIKSAIAVAVCFALCYGFSEQLFNVLVYPLIRVMPEGGKLIFTGLPEAFFTYLKVSFFAGIILASPVLLYQFWMFVAPGLYGKERHILGPVIAITSFFFIGGALFGYFVVFPFGFKFLLSFGSDFIRTLPSMHEYLDFSIKLLLIFGLLFELPVLLALLAHLDRYGRNDDGVGLRGQRQDHRRELAGPQAPLRVGEAALEQDRARLAAHLVVQKAECSRLGLVAAVRDDRLHFQLALGHMRLDL